MKKTLISLAIATGMAISGSALAEATVYGNVHISIDSFDTNPNVAAGDTDDALEMNTNTSSIGVKGSEDLGDGMKAMYKVEYQIDPTNRCNSDDVTLTVDDAVADGGNGDGVVDLAEVSTGSSGCDSMTDRDQWVGLKGGMGTVKFGTMSSNYKQMGGKIDPMYRTLLEGRGFLSLQSGLHNGAGINRGRMVKLVQFSSPKMGGMQLILNTTVSGATGQDDETTGVGFRYKGKSFSAYFDTVSIDVGATTETASKVGGKFKAGPITIGAQLESSEDVRGNDYTFLSANYKLNGNTNIAVNAGTMGDSKGSVVADGSTGFAVLYNHKLGKKTNVYAGYGDLSEDTAGASGVSLMTFGIRKKF